MLSGLKQSLTQFNTTEKNKVKFGCRFFAYMTPKAAEGQDEFIRSCLVTGNNALKKQGNKDYCPDNQNALSWDAFYNNGKNRDGWGVVNYSENHAVYIRKGVPPASEDPNFDSAVTQASKTPSNVVLAHLRAGRNQIKENLHPFNYQGWSFMHNGIVPVKVSEYLQKGIDKQFGKSLDVTVKGTTDTEKVFYTLMGKVKERFGSVRLTEKDYPELIEIFKTEVRHITDLAKEHGKGNKIHKRVKDLTGFSFTEDSLIKTRPSYNFVLANSDILIASCYNRTMHLGVFTNSDGEREMMLASEPIQPSAFNHPIQWWQVPNEHMVVMKRTGEGIQPSIFPF